MLIDMRRELGCDTIQRGEVREVVATLRAGKPVAFLVDQDTDDVKGAFVPFFGRLAHTPIGPAALAVRMGVPVVMGFISWEGLTRHRVHVLPALRPREDLPREEQVLELTARMTKIGEDEIRKRPDHWVWVHRRWETRPEDHPDYPVYPPATS
jgi:KDO2-lipid IV(A) lauroyltransferase